MADTLYLEYNAIDDISPLLPHLAAMENLTRLYLFGNKLTGLPDDLSELVSLDTLDISNNPIADVKALIPGLSSLPRLKHLIIPAPTRRDAEVIVAHLPNLESLNGEGLNLKYWHFSLQRSPLFSFSVLQCCH